jgi:hypothetical protein
MIRLFFSDDPNGVNNAWHVRGQICDLPPFSSCCLTIVKTIECLRSPLQRHPTLQRLIRIPT